MFKLKDFQTWIDKKEIIKYPRNILENYNIGNDVVNILVDIGLPSKVEPFLWFLSIDNGALKRLNEFYDLENENYKEEFIKSKQKYLEKFIVLGRSSGHAICLNEKQQIVYVNYNNFAEHFINETLEQLLEFILCFDNMVKKIQRRYKEKIDYSDYVTNEDICVLKENLCNITNDSLQKYDFWNESIEFLEEQIEYQ